MPPSKKTSFPSAELRDRAEKWLRLSRKDIAGIPMPDVQELVHELQVHQVELQMQNEDLRQTQQDLEASRDKYCDLFDLAPIGYLTLDRNGVISNANLLAAQLLNKPRQEIIGRRISQFIASESQGIFHLHNRKVLSTKKPQLCEIELVRPDASRVPVQMDSLAVAGTDGQYRVALTDISVLKKMEEELIRTRDEAVAANKAKSQFLANMSHEIRTPLNAIVGLGHILKKSEPLSEEQKAHLGVLQSSAASLLELINELLDIAKIEACGMELERLSFDMSELIADILGMLEVKAQEKGLALIQDNRLTHRTYWGDPLRIRQVVTNLVGNAIKFTHSGSVTVSLEKVSQENGYEKIIFSVRDTGIGIPRAKQEVIFDAFTQADASMTRKYGGTGLGLAICKQLVEHMGGALRVASQEGQGATFTFEVKLEISHEKLSPPEGNVESITVAHLEPASAQPRLLLVEDHPTNVLIASTFLESFDYRFDVASNGEEAVRLSSEHRYAVILMDVQMQDMDGFEATRRIREAERLRCLPPTPIIAMTAHALMGDREKCIDAGMSDYISKPFNPDKLRGKLERHLLAHAA